MPDSAPLLTCHALPPGEDFLPTAARLILPFIQAPAGSGPDLGQRRLIVPGLPLASELRRELGRESGRSNGGPLFLPPCETLARWAGTVVLENPPLPESERLLLLRQALAERGWFDDGALWGVAAEMAALFDELTTHAVALPGDEADFLAQLEAAYHLRASAPLAFEARVVHELWRVLAGLGRPDAPGAYALRLARLAEAAAAPLVVILDGPPDSACAPAEREFFARYAERQPVLLLHPQHRAEDPAPLARLLATAWPMADEVPPLAERAAALSAELAAAGATSPLSGRLAILAARGREQEARAAAATVLQWLDQGKRRIALIAQDRLVARRVRALLERREVLVADEAGWKLSTSRAGAAIDGLLETTAANVYYRDLLDLLKSPFLFDDVEEGPRKAAVFTLERAVRDANARSGLGAMGRALEHKASPGAAARLAGELLNRVAVAVRILSGRDTGIADWAARLERALEAVGALSRLRDDAAGAVILDLLARRREELGASEARFGFSVWRDWLNRELESETFRDHSI
ncbi:MAG: Inactivated superfamily I helicase, partial [Betaproteobacteria bacterium]|nr:Inactivated superfamily I helicase [Betaproteobacteria bacterium]